MSFLTAVPIIEKREKEKENEKETQKDKIKEFNHVEEQYLSYLINKETKYANIEKIEKKYRIIIIEKYNKYNENKVKIEKKKIEYKRMIIDLEQELIKNYKMKNKLLQDYYDKSIDDMIREIKMKDHEQITYQNMYDRLYKTNIMIKRRIEQEIILEPIVLNQYNEYNMLKNHALVSLKSQEQMLNNMKKFKEKENEKFIEKKMKKRNKINYLDIQIQLIKNEVKNNEEKINKIKEIEDEIKEKIYEKEKTYKIIQRDIDWNKKDYYKNYIQIMKILFYLKVNSINELIPTFNHIKEEYQGLHNKFAHYNLEISKLNNRLTQQEKRLNEIKKKIELKRKNKEYHNDNLIVRRKESKIRETKFYCNLVTKNINDKFIVVQKLIDFMHLYINKIRSDLSFLISKQKIKKFTKLIIADVNLNNILEVKKSLSYLFNLFQHFSILLMKCIFSVFNNLNIEYINNNNLKKNSFLFPLFHPNIVAMFYQSLIKAIKQADVKNQIKNEAELLSNLKTNDKNNMINEKDGISQKELFNQFTEYLYREGIDIENKKAIQNYNKNLYKSNIDFFKREKNKKISILNKTPSLILNKTINSFNSTTYSSVFDSSLFLLKHPKQIMKIMEKYQNDLVFPEKENYTFRQRRSHSNQLNYKKIIVKKNTIDNFNNSFYQKNLKKEESKRHSIIGFSEEISDHSSEEYEENEKKKKVELKKKILEENRNKTRSFKDNPEMALIYKRMNDLYFLQLSYLRNKKEFGVDDFKEIYFNFQRKYMNKNKFKIKSLNKNKVIKYSRSIKNNSLDSRKLSIQKLNLSKVKSEEINNQNHSLNHLIKN